MDVFKSYVIGRWHLQLLSVEAFPIADLKAVGTIVESKEKDKRDYKQ